MLKSLAVLVALAGAVVAAPINALESRSALCRQSSIRDNGVYSLPCTTYAAAMTCPKGYGTSKYGTVLLVHGTGSRGIETWGGGPYLELLPAEGFDVCYVDLPNRALSDAQVSAEYVAYLTHALALHSKTGHVGLVSHSQGGLNVQWALDFWPALRGIVSSFVAIAPDFHGTAEGAPLCLVLGLTEGGCNPSVIQQSQGSLFLDALNAKGNVALVPTTSIYTAYDDVIQPELIAPTSRLNGATVVRLQDECSALTLVDHFIIPFNSYAYALAVDALKNKRAADIQTISKASCAWQLDDVVLSNKLLRGPIILRQAVNDALAVLTYPKVTKEPLPAAYVCKRGDLTSGCAAAL